MSYNPVEIIKKQLLDLEKANPIMLKEIGNNIVQKTKDKAPSKTGALKNSIEIENIDKNSVTVSSDLSYAKYVLPNDIKDIVGNETTIIKIIDKNIKKIF